MIIVVGIAFLLHPKAKAEPISKEQITTGIKEAAIVANIRLAEHNKTDGIEYVRGPFSLDDYDCNFAPLLYEKILVKYQYKKQDDCKGWPDFFDITVRFYDTLELPKPTAPPPAKEEFDVIGELSDKDLQAIAETFRAFCNYKEGECPAQYYTTDMITISNKGRVQRSHNAVYGCHSILRLDNNTVLVMYNVKNGWEHNRIDLSTILREKDYYDKYRELLISLLDEPGQHLLFEKKGTAWQACFLSDHDHRKARSPVRWKKQRPKLKHQQIELRGKLADEQLMALLNDAVRVRGMPEVIRAIQVGGHYALVSAGKYLQKVPDNAITVERSGKDWKVVRHYDLSDLDLMTVSGDMSRIFPLLPKPRPNRLASAVKRCKAPRAMSQRDVEDICELVLRLPDIDGRISRIKFVGKDKVEVMIGSFGSEIIELRKVGSQWTFTAKSVVYF